MSDITIHPTPNPNSLKFTADSGSIISSGMLAFNFASEAADHALGRALFDLEGVINVFVLPQFLTVTKSPAADWDALINDIKRITSNYVARQKD